MITVQVHQVDPQRILLFRSAKRWEGLAPVGYPMGSALLDHLPAFIEEDSQPAELIYPGGGLAVGVGEFVTKDTPDRVPFSYLDRLWGTTPILTWKGADDRLHVNWRFLDLEQAVLFP